ncbi:hypothetical protein BDV96DRAFT_634844 [Lophiotrema nucula]|uniref:Uncharacterized protein n=1 Tax=Lophiotrema nucula TaxID=690887 RepID=A0A6A5YZM8_9PLEO|nr:hypothetical protein BDV96DRAFT_634844 [Lophiotrema nucula]
MEKLRHETCVAKNGKTIESIVRRNIKLKILNPTAVARGAVLRALSKSDGPERFSQCSYGLSLKEPYMPEEYEAHRNATAKIDDDDGCWYVERTIDWKINKGSQVPNGHEIKFLVRQTFAHRRRKLGCTVDLYVSDKEHKSHYPLKHASNKGTELARKISLDWTILKKSKRFQPEMPLEDSVYKGQANRMYWAVYYDVVLILEGRNPRYEARWPSSPDLRAGEEQQVYEQGQICVAAAFKPGIE